MQMTTEEQGTHANAVATPLHGCGLRFAHLPDWLAHQGPPCLLELHTENLVATALACVPCSSVVICIRPSWRP